MTFGDFLWLLLLSYLLIAYLMLLFAIFSDVFRDRETGGFAKFLWIMFLIIAPFLGILVCLMARGNAMSEWNARAASAAESKQNAYIKSVAGSSTSAADEIASAKSLLDGGAITAAEFEAIKAKALA